MVVGRSLMDPSIVMNENGCIGRALFKPGAGRIWIHMMS